MGFQTNDPKINSKRTAEKYTTYKHRHEANIWEILMHMVRAVP